MNKQRFLIELQDAQGHTIEFERWPFRSVKRSMDSMAALYGGWGAHLYADALNRSTQIVAYEMESDPAHGKEVQRIPVSEFRRMIAEQQQKEHERRAASLATLERMDRV